MALGMTSIHMTYAAIFYHKRDSQTHHFSKHFQRCGNIFICIFGRRTNGNPSPAAPVILRETTGKRPDTPLLDHAEIRFVHQRS